MASDRALLACLFAACGSGGTPSVTPSVITADQQSQPLRIGDLAATDYLTTTGDRLALAADYRATIGGVDTVVGGADASGVTVTLAQPLALGDYALDLITNARSWHVEHALAVVATGTLGGDAGGDASPDAPADASPDAPPDASPDAPPDASPDAPPDASPDAAPPCFGAGLVKVCFATAPTGALDLPNGVLDTDTSSLCVPFTSPNGTTGCVVAADTITASGNTIVTAVGSRPLILVAATSLTLSGSAQIDVASHVGGAVGAGSSPSCTPGSSPSGVAGGYGASFGGRGGGGGGGGGGNAPSVSPITALTGGCTGSDGAGAAAGLGGRGGGAVYLLAGSSITISGNTSIDASGASGLGGGHAASGGGGGGSGGTIGIEAPSIMITGGARLFANGGAGGGGSALSPGAAGTDSTSPTTAANGGAGALLAGSGGDGSHGTTLTGASGTALLGSGGGGGGGAGVITLRDSTLTITVVPSPPAS